MMGKMKFAELARKANARPIQEEQETAEIDQEEKIEEKPRTETFADLPPLDENKYVLDEAYFIPISTIKEKAIKPKKPVARKMSGFTRMGSYKSAPLKTTDESIPLMDSCSSDTKSTGVSSEGSNEAVEEKEGKSPAKSGNIFARRKITEAADPTQLKENPFHRRGVVIDPFQQNNIRSKLKTRLRKIVDERLTVKQIFSRYVESSTLHGFLYTCSDTYIIRRFLWACLMILGAIYFLVKLREGIIEYFEYPFSTLSIIDFPDILEFPTISFCLVNGYKHKELNESRLGPLLQNGRFPIHSSWLDPGYDIPGDELVEVMNNISFTPSDVFEECDWIKRDTAHPSVPPNKCDAANFTTFFNKQNEKCFMLNSNQKGHPLLKVNHEGLKYGYEGLFDMRTSSAFLTHPFAGLRVYIHSHHEPAGSGSSFLLSPGFHYYVKMDMHETHNLEPPYSTQCGEIQLKYFDTYNQKACLLEKLTDYVGEKCGCREPFMAENGLPSCSLKQTILCSLSAKDSFSEYKFREGCPVDCVQHYYRYQITDSRFLHNPPTGVEAQVLRNENARKGQNSSHMLELVEELSPEELAHYVE
ncbi:acid-sensing ion channel 2-like isoform X1 [Clytia hemisphaerica]|eukprot:TCONS_00014185-protein